MAKPDKATVHKTMAQAVDYLCGRWDDEHEFEDFKEYIAHAKKVCEDCGAEFVKLIEDPFTCTFKFEGAEYTVQFEQDKVGDDIVTVRRAR